MNLIYTELNDFLHALIREDIGTGDITTNACVPEDATATGRFIAKDSGILYGLSCAIELFGLIDPKVTIVPKNDDGDLINSGDVIAQIYGPARGILSGERIALNLMGHLSGVATKTAEYENVVAGAKVHIRDTRKTTPGMRVLEKLAVRVGGGSNHRFNLSDGILIKDNHIKAAGGIANAVAKMKQNNPNNYKIEVETESLNEVQQALDAGADMIMFDNMSINTMAEAVKLVNGRALTEASGGMSDRDLKEVAATGVDFISIGGTTHSVKWIDISLNFD